MSGPAFDSYASGYDEALGLGLSVSGEGRDYFAAGRVAFLAACLGALGFEPRRLMDFGCGTGAATPHLLHRFRDASLIGIDVSKESVALASRTHGSERASFAPFDGEPPPAPMDLVHTNGVFHHISLGEREAALRFTRRCLRPGGILAFWENNPWNPGTRYVMSRIPFDRDAILLTSREARRLLRGCGFEVLRTDFLFIFPRALRLLRGLERRLSRWPLGAQYQVLCRKP